MWLAALVLAIAAYSPGAAAEGPFPIDDAAITAQVERAISREPSLAASDITVVTREGTVTLEGFARTMEDIAKAAQLARAVRGVTAVTNGIRVANRPSRA